MIVLIGAIWFIPGVIVRRILDERIKKNKAESQAKRISSLYPKQTED